MFILLQIPETDLNMIHIVHLFEVRLLPPDSNLYVFIELKPKLNLDYRFQFVLSKKVNLLPSKFW